MFQNTNYEGQFDRNFVLIFHDALCAPFLGNLRLDYLDIDEEILQDFHIAEARHMKVVHLLRTSWI